MTGVLSVLTLTEKSLEDRHSYEHKVPTPSFECLLDF